MVIEITMALPQWVWLSSVSSFATSWDLKAHQGTWGAGIGVRVLCVTMRWNSMKRWFKHHCEQCNPPLHNRRLTWLGKNHVPNGVRSILHCIILGWHGCEKPMSTLPCAQLEFGHMGISAQCIGWSIWQCMKWWYLNEVFSSLFCRINWNSSPRLKVQTHTWFALQ